MKSKVKHIVKNFKTKIESIYQDRLSKVVLFGSQSRNEAVDGSDIDILIVLKDKEVNPSEELKVTIDIIASLSLEFDKVISCIFVSEDRYFNEKSPLLINIRKEGIAV